MVDKMNFENCDLSFLKGTIYRDMRFLGRNAFSDIKASLASGTSSDLVFYLAKHSRLLKPFQGDEQVLKLSSGTFSTVYLLKSKNGRQLVVKKSFEGQVPLMLFKNISVPMPRFIINSLFDDYEIGIDSLKRDIHDYENVIKPFWGQERIYMTDKAFEPILNLALTMVEDYIPKFDAFDLHSLRFWNKALKNKKSPLLEGFKNYLSAFEKKPLIPQEERFVFFEAKSNSLQTIFIQEASIGSEEVLPDKYLAFPFELVSEGVIFNELPKLMLEHMLIIILAYVEQLRRYKNAKVPDYRPFEGWKLFPPSPYEVHLAETNNLIVHKDKKGKLFVTFIDTHILLDRDANQIFKWVETRYWISLFLNIRFWMRKILKDIK